MGKGKWVGSGVQLDKGIRLAKVGPRIKDAVGVW